MDKPLTREHKEKLKEWIEGSRSLRVLVTGKTGVGKSALVNGIVGKYIAIEGETLDPQTASVEKYQQRIQDVDVEIFDSPGLQDGTAREKEYLADMELKCKHVDLILYCVKMDDPRFYEDDKQAISKITGAFGIDFWKNAICVLTFANKVQQPIKKNTTPMDAQKYFQKKIEDWQRVFCRELVTINGVDKRIAEVIPIVPTGHYTEPCLPDRESWLGELWFTCLDRVADDAKPAFLKINWSRLHAQDQISQQNFSNPLHKQIIPCSADRLQTVAIPPVILQMIGEIGGVLGGLIGEALGSPDAGKQIGKTAAGIIAQVALSYAQKYNLI